MEFSSASRLINPSRPDGRAREVSAAAPGRHGWVGTSRGARLFSSSRCRGGYRDFAWSFELGSWAGSETSSCNRIQRAGVMPRDYPAFSPGRFRGRPVADRRSSQRLLLPDARRPLGWLVRAYLWFQIAAGWALSSIFVVAVTGLVRS